MKSLFNSFAQNKKNFNNSKYENKFLNNKIYLLNTKLNINSGKIILVPDT